MAYTSNDEFNAERRVQLTNEIRPLDIYEGVNSTLKNDIWQWLLGWTEVTTDLKFDKRREDPTDEVHFDKDYNAYSSDYPSKLVNGVIAKNYGEKEKEVWDPKQEKYVKVGKAGLQHLEIDGALLPEHDLFLHEIYRYLSCLYPDHPDWLKLLTHNEIVDSIENAAEMVGYKPDDRFFQLVAENMEKLPKKEGQVYDTIKGVPEVEVEEFKLLLRNLTNNATRRKFYGANDGLKMFASAIGELSSCFPVGEYLPIEPKKFDENNIHYQAYSDKDLNIDIFDPNYKKPFRIIDWTGKSRDISLEDETIDDVIAFTTPGKEKYLIEAHDPSDPLPEASSAKNIFDFKTLFKIPVLKNGISYLQEIDAKKSKTISNIFEEDGKLSYYTSDINVNNKRIAFKILQDFPVRYAKCYAYKKITDVDFTKLGEAGISLTLSMKSAWPLDKYTDKEVYNRYYVQSSSTLDFYRGVISCVYNDVEGFNTPNELSYTWNDSVNGIMLTPREMLKLYPLSTTYTDTGSRIPDNPTFREGFPMDKDTVLSTDKIGNLNSFDLLAPVGVNKAVLDIECESEYGNIITFPDYFGEWQSEINNGQSYKSHVNTYGIVIKNNHNELIAVEGSMRVHWAQRGKNGYTEPGTIRFYIESIPQVKSESLCKILYPDWDSLDDNQKDEYRKNRDLICETKNYITSKDVTKHYESISFEHGNEIMKIYQNDARVVDSKLVVTAKEMEFMRNKGKITDIDLGYISLVRYLDVNRRETINFSFISKGQLANQDSLDEETLKKYYNRNGINVTLSEEGKVFNKELPILLPNTAFIENTVGNVKEKDQENIFSLTSTRLWTNFIEQAATNNGEVLITAIKNELNRLDIEAHREDYVSSDTSQDFLHTLIFAGAENLRKFEALSVGDLVEGNGIESGTFIIWKGTNSIRVNKIIPKSGTLIYKFWTSVEAYPTNITEDFRNYKVLLKENKSLETVNPWNNGLYGSDDWPHVSNSFINGLVDPQDFTPWNNNHTNFGNVMRAVYQDKLNKYGAENTLLIPSTVTLGDLLYYEINANKLIQVPNRDGHVGNIMNVEWLDYLDNNLNTVTQASEKTNVGVNIMMQTDTSETYSQRKEAKWTDDDLHLKFQAITPYTPGITVPSYIQVGTDGSNYEKYFKLPKDIVKPNVYGAVFFDHPMKDLKEKMEDPNLGKYEKRHVYSKGDKGIIDVPLELKEVDNPLFEIPLGEYDIQQGFSPLPTEEDPTGILKADTVSASFGKQVYSNLTKKLDTGVLQASNKDLITTELFAKNDKLVFNGVYLPNPNKEGTDFDFPSPQKDWDLSKIYYYTVMDSMSFEFSVIKEGKQYKEYREIRSGDFILYKKDNKNEWKHYLCRAYYNGLGFDIDLSQSYTQIIQKYKNIEGKEVFTDNLINNSEYNRDKSFYTGNSYFNECQLSEDELTRSFVYRASRNKVPSKEKDFELNEIIELKKKVKEEVIFNVERNKNENQDIYYLPITGIISKVENSGSYNIQYYVLDWDEASDTFNSYLIKPGLFSSSMPYNEGLRYVSKSGEITNIAPEEFTIFSGNIQSMPNLYFKGKIIPKPENDPVVLTSDLSVIDIANTEFQLPRKFITNGSYDIRFKIDPKFISKGYLYDMSLDKPLENEENLVNFNVSQNKIFYDDKNKCFFTNADTYKGIEPKTKSTDNENEKEFIGYKIDENNKNVKVKLKFEEQKFFKNKYIFTAKYKKDTTLKEKSSEGETSQLLYSLDRVPINCNYLSTSDKILEVNEVFLRSDYSPKLEPMLASNYSQVEGEIYGVSVDEKGIANGLLIGAEHEPNTDFNYKKLLLAADIKQNFEYITDIGKLSPLDPMKVYNFDSEEIKSVNLTTPLLKKASVLIPSGLTSLDKPDASYKDFESDKFKFYKNYLIIKGEVDVNHSNIIWPTPSNKDIFIEAIKTLSSNDEVIQAISLGTSSLDSRKTIQVYGEIDGNLVTFTHNEIQKVIYENNVLVLAGANEGSAYIYWDTVPSIETLDIIKLTNYKSLNEKGNIQSLKFDLFGNIVVTIENNSIQTLKRISLMGEDPDSYDLDPFNYKNSGLEPNDNIAILDPENGNIEIIPETGEIKNFPDVFDPSSKPEFVDEQDISKTTDEVYVEVQTRTIYAKKESGVTRYFLDKEGTVPVIPCPGSKITPAEKPEEKPEESLIEYTETVKAVLCKSLPHSVIDPDTGKVATGVWYESSSSHEILIRGNGHLFINSPVKQLPGSPNGSLTERSYWTYGKIPTLVDTLQFALESTDPVDIGKNLIEVMKDYKEFFDATDGYVEAKKNWEEKHKDDGKKFPEPESPVTMYDDYTDLQKLHYSLHKNGKFNVMDYDTFKKIFKNFSSSSTTFTCPIGDEDYSVPLVKAIYEEAIETTKEGEKPETKKTPVWAIVGPEAHANKVYDVERTYSGQLDIPKMYIAYAFDWIRTILGGSPTQLDQFILSGEIKESIIHKDTLYLLLENNRVISFDLKNSNSHKNIEESRNWKSLKLPPRTTYISDIDQKYIEKAVGPEVYFKNGDTVTKTSQKLISDMRTIFNLDNMYSHQETLFYYGSYDKIEDIEHNYTPPIEELDSPNEPFAGFYGKADNDRNLPAILYTNSSETELRELNLFDLFTSDNTGITANNGEVAIDFSKIRNLYIEGIQAVRGSVYISLKAEINDNTSVKVVRIDNKIKVFFKNGKVCDMSFEDIKLRPRWTDADFSTILNSAKSSKCQGGELTVYSESGKGQMFDNAEKTDNYTFDYTFPNYAISQNLSIASKNTNSITLNKSLLAANIVGEENEKVPFLFAIKTHAQITNQFKYLATESDIYDKLLELQIREEVKDASMADMFYNENDVMLDGEEIKNGNYPSVEEDMKNKKCFLYSQDTGELLPYLNSSAHRIYKCNKEGKLLAYTGEFKSGRKDDSCFFDLKDGVLNFSKLGDKDFARAFVPAGRPVTINIEEMKDLIVLEKDENFYKDWIIPEDKTEIDPLNIDLSELSFTSSYAPRIPGEDPIEIPRDGNPYLLFKTPKVIDKIQDFSKDYLLEVSKEFMDKYIEYLKKDEEDGTYTAEEYLQKVLTGSDKLQKATIEYLESYKHFIRTCESEWGTRGNSHYPHWYDRITYKQLKTSQINSEGEEEIIELPKYFLFDNNTQVFVLKIIRRLKGSTSVHYKTNMPTKLISVADTGFIFKDNILYASPNDTDKLYDLAVQGVQISTAGYGGELYGQSTIVDWSENVTPWKMDPEAFESKQILDDNKNEIGKEFIPIVNIMNEPVYLYNEYGRAITDSNGNPIQMMKPKYKNFKKLLTELGQNIKGREYNVEGKSISEIDNSDLNIKIVNVDTLNKTVVISGDLKYKNGELVDNTILSVSALTVADIPLLKEYENDDRYFHELTLKELDSYPANRVWFNPTGIPSPVVPLSQIEDGKTIKDFSGTQITDGYYRKENQYAFYTIPYKNENGINIYECDKTGHYIKYAVENGKVVKHLTDPKSKKDDRFNPSKPIFDTCQDWFSEMFYNPKEPSNPFWQIVRVFPVFNKNLKKFVSDIKTYEYEKSTYGMNLRELPSDKAYFSLYNTPIKEENKGELYVIPKASFIDLKSGKVRFLMGEPEDKSLEHKKDLVKFGISYINSFYLEKDKFKGLLSEVWTGTAKLDATATLNYTINSKEDLSDTSNKDAGIVRVTELGIFDQHHNLVLYSTFPPIEYRSDTQHISFTCIVNWKTLFDYTDKSESNPYRDYEVPKCKKIE